jgi:hypothetical protein
LEKTDDQEAEGIIPSHPTVPRIKEHPEVRGECPMVLQVIRIVIYLPDHKDLKDDVKFVETNSDQREDNPIATAAHTTCSELTIRPFRLWGASIIKDRIPIRILKNNTIRGRIY